MIGGHPTLSVDVHLQRDGFALDARFDASGRITGLLGRSGSGKTTVLHLVAGLLRPTRGRIAFGDTCWCDTQEGIWVPPHRRGVGIVFQDTRLLPHLSVEKNLRYGMRRGASDADLIEIVEILEIAKLLQRQPAALSGGEAQRVAIGRALLSRPQLLLLDEPMTGLDDRLRSRTTSLMMAACARARVPVVYVSHHLADILQHTNHAIMMERGRVAGSGTISDLVADDELFTAARDLGLLNVLRCRLVGCTERDAARDDLVAVQVIAEERASPAQLFLAARSLPTESTSDTIHVAIRPQDVALAREHVAGTSIQNQIRARIVAMHVHDRSVIVEADCGQTVLVEISQRAMRELDLAVGADAWLLIKANALRAL